MTNVADGGTGEGVAVIVGEASWGAQPQASRLRSAQAARRGCKSRFTGLGLGADLEPGASTAAQAGSRDEFTADAPMVGQNRDGRSRRAGSPPRAGRRSGLHAPQRKIVEDDLEPRRDLGAGIQTEAAVGVVVVRYLAHNQAIGYGI